MNIVAFRNSFIFTLATLVTLSFSGLFFLQYTYAQYGYEILDETGITEAPNLFIDQINLNQDSYKTGEVITGSFKLFNVGEVTADRVSYRAHLIETDTVGTDVFPRNILFSGSQSSKFSIESGSLSKRISLKLPETIPAGTTFAVYIEAIIDDETATYEYTPVAIEGKVIPYVEYVGALYVEDEPYYFLEGPTVLDSEQVELRLSLSSASTQSGIVPVLRIFDGPSATGNLVTTETFPPFAVVENQELEQIYPLPLDVGPGVYTAELVFKSQDEDSISSQLLTRYVIDGLKPNIHRLYYNELDQNKISQFELMIEYADTPINTRLDENGEFIDERAASVFVREGEEAFIAERYDLLNNVSAKVFISNAVTGAFIAEATIDSAATNPIPITFDPITSATRIAITVELLMDNEIVDTYETEVVIVPQDAESTSQANYDTIFFYILVALILLVLLAIIVVFSKFFSNKKIIKNDENTQ